MLGNQEESIFSIHSKEMISTEKVDILIDFHSLISLFTGTRFFCSQLIAPIRDEAGDICLYVLNFEDLTSTGVEESEIGTAGASELSSNHLKSRCKFNRACKTKLNIKFANMQKTMKMTYFL